jgi:ABC-type multidrug transport system fused ATPase/permease subunit
MTSLSAIRETQLLNIQKYFIDRFDRYIAAETGNMRKTQHYMLAPGVLNDSILTIGIAVIFGVSILVLDSRSALPTLAVIFGAAYRYLPAVTRMSIGLNSLRLGAASIDKYRAEMRQLDSLQPAGSTRATVPRPFRNEIRFEDVTFQYPAAAGPSVRSLTFAIGKGETIGVVGASGSGKTTLALLLLGLYQPQAGRIAVDGDSIAGDMAAWQACLGYVPQNVVVTDDTVRRNVAFGIEDANIDEARVIDALQQAQLLARVRSEPEGLDAVLGERGARLSGGEIQRLGIARAIYRNAQVLVLDEATSALDSVTESAIAELIRTLSDRMTIVIIAHRLSTLRHVDRLLYLQDGALVAQGTFEGISASSAEFRDLLRSAEFSLVPSQSALASAAS